MNVIYVENYEFVGLSIKISGSLNKELVGLSGKVILETNPNKARDLCRETAKIYNRLPNYRNNWLRMGLSEEDIDSLSNKFIDTTFDWGSSKDIEKRVKEHIDAGANHVCIQPINPNGKAGDIHWECLESLIALS